MSVETDLAALAHRTIGGATSGADGIEVRWWPSTDGTGHWMIKLAVGWLGKNQTRRRWVDVRAKTLLEVRVQAERALVREGR